SNYSIYIPGNTAYGIRAFGTTMGGRFEDTGGSGRGYVGYANWDFYGNGSGNAYFTGSTRSPIFYDSDDTSYWVNPSGQLSGKFYGEIEVGHLGSSGPGYSRIGIDIFAGDDLGWHDTGTGSDQVCYYNSSPYKIVRCSSSIRFKENVEDLNMKGIETLMKLRPVEYNWIQENGGKKDFGLIAEEVAEVNPLLATYEKDEEGNDRVLSVRYNHFTALLTKAIQEQQSEIDSLKERIKKLESHYRNNIHD
ncbi:MAG: tail fiber domain-containing protein, partial [Candidatus Paceibacterota bacterium]